jgi:hypothetical protein
MRRARLALTAMVVAGSWLALSPGEAGAQKKNRDVITREEILNSPQKDQDILQVIRSLRPHFLAPPRGTRSLGGGMPLPTVLYINGNKSGELDGLKYIMAADVIEVRYLDAAKAQDEYGMDHSGGAVQVKLIEGVKPKPASL